jgi:hypothetical protein
LTTARPQKSSRKSFFESGLPTPAATKLLRKFLKDKGAFHASADMIAFPENKSGVEYGVRCIRILVGLDFNYEMNDEDGDESDGRVCIISFTPFLDGVLPPLRYSRLVLQSKSSHAFYKQQRLILQT